jgi:adenine-specific DNA-methyltransferase
MLVKSGELVAITPRSFCNGTYFRPFRRDVLSRFRFRRIHVFERRDEAFRDDEVLQENIIFSGRRTTASEKAVIISVSDGDLVNLSRIRSVPSSHVVRADDREAFIHIVPEEEGHTLAERLRALPSTLHELNLSVSTGRVVDFRAREWLRTTPGDADAPLIYPHHLVAGYAEWPRQHAKKPSAIAITAQSEALLVPPEVYVLVKRFTAKEEPRRVVAAIFDPSRIECKAVGIENHLNYIHRNGRGLPMELAKGLSAYLNSTAFDCYFRQFSGHTQVNATDLRNVAFPSQAQLIRLGQRLGDLTISQAVIDDLVEDLLNARLLPRSPRDLSTSQAISASRESELD